MCGPSFNECNKILFYNYPKQFNKELEVRS